MRRGILFCLCLLLAGSFTWLALAEKDAKSTDAAGLGAPAGRELLVNGDFAKGIEGWQLDTAGGKPVYQAVRIGETAGQAIAVTANHGEVARLSQRVTSRTPFVRLSYKANFLSTRGNGYVKVTAVDDDGNPLGVLGWVVSGDMPPAAVNEKWYDVRVPLNTQGDWLSQDIMLAEQFVRQFSQADFSKVGGYQIDFIVTNGQHGIFADVHMTEQSRDDLRITLPDNMPAQSMGRDFTVVTQITNRGKETQKDVVVHAFEPYGWGLVVKEPVQRVDAIGPGETKALNWVVSAQRPSTVNLESPWELGFQIEGGTQQAKTSVMVEDQRPGTVYYVLTDDLEPIDGAGYEKAYGNCNAWLDPEEFYVQLVQKAERLNAIADVYGAKWSHYIAWPAITGAQWAAEQSTTGAWPPVISAIEQSVRQETAKGHEYAVHMHSDYDPRFPGAILRYNAEADGFWANHRRHGWTRNLPELGTADDVATRTGSIYYYHARLTDLMRESGQGQIVATRTGSFDFGDNPTDENKSLEVYRRAGLWAGSDADGNIGGPSSADFTQNLYFTGEDDINRPARDLRKIGILQFKPTPVRNIAYDTDNADVLNRKVAEGISAFSSEGQIKAGVHAIVGFTHAMFVMGESGWQSLTGGQFAELDRHLNYVQQNFAGKGLLRYGTSSELAKAYWDYYTPKLLALYGPEQQQGRGTFIYPVRLIGSQIPVDTGHIHNVTMKYPLYLRDKAYKIEVRKNGQVIMKTWGLPTPFNDIVFPVDDRNAEYTLHVYADETRGKAVRLMRGIWQKIRAYKVRLNSGGVITPSEF